MDSCDKVQNITNAIASALGIAIAATAAFAFAFALLNWAGGCGHHHGLCVTLADLVQ